MEISLLAIGDRPENYTFRLFKAILEKRGYRVNLIYVNVCRLHENITLTPKLREEIGRLISNSGIIGMYVFTYNFDVAVDLTDYIKRTIGSLVLWGGPHAIAESEECAQHADIVCVHQGEEVLVKIIESYERHGPSFDKTEIPNIVYMDKGKLARNEIKKLSFSLNTLPYQDYSLKRHYYVNSENRIASLTVDALKKRDLGRFAYVTMIARGCPFKCSYCLNSNSMAIPFYLDRSVDNVIGEVKEAMKFFNGKIDIVHFYDDDFFALPFDYIKELSTKFKKEVGLPMWPLNASAVNFSEEKLVELRKAGLTGINIGVQTISKNGRRAYGNPATRENIRSIMEVMKRHPDMTISLQMILGNPYEDNDDIVENLLFLDSLPRIYTLGNFQLIIYPGTRLFETIKRDPKHTKRAQEGYRIPYYYYRPELALWNNLIRLYLGRGKGFPRYIKYMLEKRHYFSLNYIILMQLVQDYVRSYGLGNTLRRIAGKLMPSKIITRG